MYNNLGKFLKFLMIISGAIFLTSFKNSFQDELKQIVYSVDSSWTVEFDSESKFDHSILISGNYFGLLKLKKNDDYINYYIFKPHNERLKDEILKYQMLASCTLSNIDNKIEILKIKGYLLFLPMYPCWSSGYSRESKELIEKLVSKYKY